MVAQQQGFAAGQAGGFHGCACGGGLSGTVNSGEDD
jgi:hypothetical protein